VIHWLIPFTDSLLLLLLLLWCALAAA